MLGPSWAVFLSVGVDYLPLGGFLYRVGRFGGSSVGDRGSGYTGVDKN
jgi:hypothetical protein